MIGGQQEIIDHLIALAPGMATCPRCLSEMGARIVRLHPCRLECCRTLREALHNAMSITQVYAEVFDLRKNAGSEALLGAGRFNLVVADIAEMWRRGGFITSWLLDLPTVAVANGPSLDAYPGFIEDSGEGKWTEQFDEAVAIDDARPAALRARFFWRRFAQTGLSAMRKGFGRPKALQP